MAFLRRLLQEVKMCLFQMMFSLFSWALTFALTSDHLLSNPLFSYTAIKLYKTEWLCLGS